MAKKSRRGRKKTRGRKVAGGCSRCQALNASNGLQCKMKTSCRMLYPCTHLCWRHSKGFNKGQGCGPYLFPAQPVFNHPMMPLPPADVDDGRFQPPPPSIDALSDRLLARLPPLIVEPPPPPPPPMPHHRVRRVIRDDDDDEESDGRAPNGRAPEGSIARLVDFNGGSGVRGFASWLKEVGFELISSKSKKKGGKRVRQRENACGYVAAWVASKMVRSDWTAKRAGYSDAVKKSVVVDGNEYLRVHKDHRQKAKTLSDSQIRKLANYWSDKSQRIMYPMHIHQAKEYLLRIFRGENPAPHGTQVLIVNLDSHSKSQSMEQGDHWVTVAFKLDDDE